MFSSDFLLRDVLFL
ncbi:hypothetical protein LINPERPRIM_LOCUS22099 [Linum perenne]